MPRERAARPAVKKLEFRNLEHLGRGTYTLLIHVLAEAQMDIGRLGTWIFPKGYYAYTGSALGEGALGLRGRIRRHLEKCKKKRWHIDYLLSGEHVQIEVIVTASAGRKMECKINQDLKDRLRARIPVSGFGSTDCREKCGSHLLYLGSDRDIVRRVAEAYSEEAGSMICVIDLL